MVTSAIGDKGSIVTPVWPLSIKLCRQLVKVNLHRLIVAVRLSGREINVAKGVQGHDQCDPGRQRMDWIDIGASTFSPFHAAKVRFIQPSFV